MSEKCKYAFRVHGDVSVHCRLMPKEQPWCAHQYMCPSTRRWEVSNKSTKCTKKAKINA